LLAVLETTKSESNCIILEIAFLTFLEQADGVTAWDNGAAAIVYYDVNAAEPLALVEVKNSDVSLVVWSIENIGVLKIQGEYGFVRAKDLNGRLIPFDEVNPHYMRYKYGVDSNE
jgi:hypothetical protein